MQVITMNGSVRIKTCDLELSQQTIPAHEVSGSQGATGGPGAGQIGPAGGGVGQPNGSTAASGEDGQRAVDNQYSYV